MRESLNKRGEGVLTLQLLYHGIFNDEITFENQIQKLTQNNYLVNVICDINSVNSILFSNIFRQF